MDGVDRWFVVSAGMATVIGFLLVYATTVGLAVSIAVPTLCFVQRCRRHAFLVSLAYYGAASSILIPGSAVFLGRDAAIGLPFILWASASLLLAVPYGLLWTCRPAAIWRAPLAVLASVPPPLGIIGWANPLTAAGMLFPGTSWLGLSAVLAFAGASTRYLRGAVATVLAGALLANVTFQGTPRRPMTGKQLIRRSGIWRVTPVRSVNSQLHNTCNTVRSVREPG